MKRWILPLLLAISAAAMYLSFRRITHPPARAMEPEPLAVGLSIPSFALTDQDGRAVDQSLFDGRVTILDFIFTNCPFACPMMTASMIQVAGELEKSPVRFVSISVDPAHDSPERLREFAARMELAPPRWTFLTGDKTTIVRIVHDALQFELQPDTERKGQPA
jgi:protein SCO1/2